MLSGTHPDGDGDVLGSQEPWAVPPPQSSHFSRGTPRLPLCCRLDSLFVSAPGVFDLPLAHVRTPIRILPLSCGSGTNPSSSQPSLPPLSREGCPVVCSEVQSLESESTLVGSVRAARAAGAEGLWRIWVRRDDKWQVLQACRLARFSGGASG